MIKRTFMCLIRNINSFFHSFYNKINTFARFIQISCVFPNINETSDENETETEDSNDESYSDNNINIKNYDDEFSTNYVKVDDVLESPVKQYEQLEQLEHKHQGCFIPIKTNDNQENLLNESTLSQSRHPTWMVIDDDE